jgi:aerotaxis receptor
MRLNTPISQREHLLQPGQNLVSTTDLKGRIVHCNPAFVDASGFSREELTGQPHNIIRHLDMPAEAFRDMWATLQRGSPWSGLVKNRRKNGDHYWVLANVTPLTENGQAVGFMSVRTPADREAIARAETLYRRMNDEARDGVAPRHRLEGGRLRRNGLGGRLQAMALGIARQGLAAPAIVATTAGYALGGTAVPMAWALPAAAALACGAHAWTQRLRDQPLHGMLRFAQRMAAGDLSAIAPEGGHGAVAELQLALAQLQVNLQSIVGDARQEAEHLEGAIAEIAAGNLDMSSRTESQSASLEQTAASMDQITGTVRLTAESAQQAAALAVEASSVTDAGLASVERVTGTIRAIHQASARIADISQVIDSISFQTNLLALNAAVEAARVGEQGRGFSVVAGEVRALAQRTTEAAKEIRALTESASRQSAGGVEEVDRAAAALRDSARSVGRVTGFVQQIHHAADEQLLGISQVNQAVAELDGLTQQNAAMVEELSASAAGLRERAHVMAGSVRVFRTGR